jgi:hypothetical protein
LIDGKVWFKQFFSNSFLEYGPSPYFYIAVQWIRENMLEQVETVTSEGGDGNSSEDAASRVKGKKWKYVPPLEIFKSLDKKY